MADGGTRSSAGEMEYAQSHGSNVAYRVFGAGPRDIVLVQPSMSSMRQFRIATIEFIDRLTRFARVILFDRRGQGHSDPLTLDALPSLEDWSHDIIAVMDAASSTSAAVVAFLGGVQLAICAAVQYPKRISELVLMHGHATYIRDDDYPWSETHERRQDFEEYIRAGWKGDDRWARHVRDHVGTEQEDVYRRYMRRVGSPAQVAAFLTQTGKFDVRPYLPSVAARTLVLHRRDNTIVPADAGRYLAQQISSAELVLLPGDVNYIVEDTSGVAEEIEEFLTGSRPAPEPERVLAAVLFTDIVASTDSKAKTGDKRWRETLAEHHRVVRRQIAQHAGAEVNTTGDGFLVTFDAPLRAIRCAQAIIAQTETLGVRIRAGIHAGEIERLGDDITGITVDIGARVSALAGPDEVLVSSTVRDMAIGSSIAFEERGEHELKGVPGRWRLYAVAP